MQGGKSSHSGMYEYSWFPLMALSVFGWWSQIWLCALLVCSLADPWDPLLGVCSRISQALGKGQVVRLMGEPATLHTLDPGVPKVPKRRKGRYWKGKPAGPRTFYSLSEIAEERSKSKADVIVIIPAHILVYHSQTITLHVPEAWSLSLSTNTKMSAPATFCQRFRGLFAAIRNRGLLCPKENRFRRILGQLGRARAAVQRPPPAQTTNGGV